ncbi:hypothetical protein [Synechococcus elongatus]|uniref:hypothetical protein n=1 Tax=Synechococcus elongatus TaxID=32046 RepID=UPI000F7DBB95|nr:hypothetical protein [Synechococcus elongatus]
MSTRIYPGNYVNILDAYKGNSVAAIPGRQYFQTHGYVKITGTPANVFDIVIPSPDLRQDDKPRLDVSPLVVPVGARVYSLGLRVTDAQDNNQNNLVGSKIVGTNGDRIKIASAVNTTATGQIAATALGTNSAEFVFANGTLPVKQNRFSLITAVEVTGSPLTLRLYVTNNTGTAAGSNISSTAIGGSYLIADICWYLDDDVPNRDDERIPYAVYSGQS